MSNHMNSYEINQHKYIYKSIIEKRNELKKVLDKMS